MAITKNTAAKPAAKPAEDKPKATAKPAAEKKAAAPAKKAAETPVEVTRIGRKELASSLRDALRADGFAVSPKLAESLVGAFEATLTKALNDGAEIVLPGFGKFYVQNVEERQHPNPQKSGEFITVAAHKAPKFKPGSGLKSAVNGGTTVGDE